jgi:hypothetical protein
VSLIGHNSGVIPPVHMWIYLVRRFARLVENLAITDPQLQDGWRSQAGVRWTLNLNYWGVDSDSANSRLIGSWGKQLQVRPPRDVDVLFTLPWDVYHRFEARAGNRQSQLLQEVRGVLATDYLQTTLRGDGQVVVVQLTSATVEVVPAFAFDDGQFWICDTHDGGAYRVSDPSAELAALEVSDMANEGATRRLIRILKQWQRHCDVPIKSFQLEHLAVEFLREWPYSRDLFWIDWMVRDFFAYLLSRQNGVLMMPGTFIQVPLGDAWAPKARTAHATADRAFYLERDNQDVSAGLEWQSLFGTMIPMYVA